MTIEIHQPELEALILQRMETGRFSSIEDVLMQALKSSLDTGEQLSVSPNKQNSRRYAIGSSLRCEEAVTGELLVAAMQASPAKDIDLEFSRQSQTLPVRDVSF